MNIIQEFDTIAAIATPIGTGGVGVIRISGDKSFEIIDKIYSVNHTTLEQKADWALGIVTGNNKGFITNELKDGFEPIFKGKAKQYFC